ncbi:hypothetical protein GUITHDRAFT_150108, partial [Guillardia theta CCMP2712]
HPASTEGVHGIKIWLALLRLSLFLLLPDILWLDQIQLSLAEISSRPSRLCSKWRR